MGSNPIVGTLRLHERKQMNKFRLGDRVRMKHYDRYAYGDVTIVSEAKTLNVKVSWDGDFDLPYQYWDENELELVETNGSDGED